MMLMDVFQLHYWINFLNIISVKSDYFIPDRINDGYGANIKTISILVKEKNLN